MDKNPNPIQLISQRKVDLVISVPSKDSENASEDFMIRRVATEFNVPLVTTIELASFLTKALEYLENGKIVARSLQEYYSYN
jgi:hypothetical protein